MNTSFARKIFLLLVIISAVLAGKSFCLVVGSTTAISLEPFVQLPAADNDNTIEVFATMQDGFQLEDASTSCSFHSIFPVRGLVDLNGGTLELNADFRFTNPSSFNPTGTIQANNHEIALSSEIMMLNVQAPAYFNNMKLSVSADLALNGEFHFSGTQCLIRGKNNEICLMPGAELILDSGVTLTIKDAQIVCANGTNIRCADDSCQLVLDNVTLVQTGDYQFEKGSIHFKRACLLDGGYTFAYQTTQSSTIGAMSSLTIESNTTFSYDPVCTSTDLLVFADSTSFLNLRDNSHLYVQAHGLVLKNGSMNVSGHCYFDSDVQVSEMITDTTNVISRRSILNNGIAIGNNKATDDFTMFCDDAAVINVSSGTMLYQNIFPVFSQGVGHTYSLFISSAARLQLKQSLDLGKGSVTFADKSILKQSNNTILSGTIFSKGTILSSLLIE